MLMTMTDEIQCNQWFNKVARRSILLDEPSLYPSATAPRGMLGKCLGCSRWVLEDKAAGGQEMRCWGRWMCDDGSQETKGEEAQALRSRRGTRGPPSLARREVTLCVTVAFPNPMTNNDGSCGLALLHGLSFAQCASSSFALTGQAVRGFRAPRPWLIRVHDDTTSCQKITSRQRDAMAGSTMGDAQSSMDRAILDTRTAIQTAQTLACLSSSSILACTRCVQRQAAMQTSHLDGQLLLNGNLDDARRCGRVRLLVGRIASSCNQQWWCSLCSARDWHRGHCRLRMVMTGAGMMGL
jgi:hypothetical protein